ncbi:EAL domain-containing protein [Oceanobacillus sp. CF4.6]|uniref:EAL domain-containing protein n=1 Tax=Oceanobacillus sp. CF4.6 TaxID=3373080 RepID=UPI003EE6A710
MGIFFRNKSGGQSSALKESTREKKESGNRHHLESDLHKSIKNDELIIHYQPRVETLTGRIVSAEALVRWMHPTLGLIAPNEFIPLAEETGFVDKIGDWVLRKTCLSMQEWQKENISLVPISINISAQRFCNDDWKETITAILRETNIEPDLIELELTERKMIQNEEIVAEAIKYLRELGITITIDDFGTGYSSLSYINKFPIDTIKIDQFFTKQITESENVEVIIKSLMYMTNELNINTVAEGVESFEQLDFLRQLGCQEIQGYLFSKPVPKREFQLLLENPILEPTATTITKNRRKYFRISLPFPLRAQLTVAELRGREVNVGRTEVIIDDIGPGGLRFLSNMKFPARSDITYKFETTIMNQNISVTGKIIRIREVKGVHEYGLKFSLDEQERNGLVQLLNHFLIQLRNNPFVANTDMVKDDPFLYLKKMLNSKVS